MFFLVRSLICIGLVYAMALSDRAPSSRPPIPVAAAHAAGPSGAPTRRPRLAETTKALVQQGVDALGAAARDHCLAAPQTCVDAMRKLNGLGER